jgi:hypothetical protein
LHKQVFMNQNKRIVEALQKPNFACPWKTLGKHSSKNTQHSNRMPYFPVFCVSCTSKSAWARIRELPRRNRKIMLRVVGKPWDKHIPRTKTFPS